MQSDEVIAKLLLQLPSFPFRGNAYRIIADQYRSDPLSGIGSYRKGGRYNAPGRFEALYSSDSRITALHEVEALFAGVESPRSPDVILSLEMDLHRVLFLDDPKTQGAFGVTSAELVAPYIEQQMRDGESLTQRIGRLINSSRCFSAIRVPSAAKDGAFNIVILPEILVLAPEESVRIYDHPNGPWRQIQVVCRK
jgi:RES domain-containing protein